jgi:hypothetical protein
MLPLLLALLSVAGPDACPPDGPVVVRGDAARRVLAETRDEALVPLDRRGARRGRLEMVAAPAVDGAAPTVARADGGERAPRER